MALVTSPESHRICCFSHGIGRSLAVMSLVVSLMLSTQVRSQDFEVQEAGLINLDFQADMQYAMREILSQIHGRAAIADSAEIFASEEELQSLTSLNSEDLLAQNDTVEVNSDSLDINGTADSELVIDEDLVTLNFQGADINALINLVSQVTGKSFIVDPRVRGKVTLVSGGGLPVDQLYEIFLSVLEVSNFAAVQSGPVTKIIPQNLIKQNPTATTEDGLPEDSDEQFTHIITLEHASVSELMPILRPLLPPTAHIAPHVGSNTLILTGTGANINRAVNLIHRMDREQRGVDIQVIYLKHADATKLGPIISQTVTAFSAEAAKQGQPPSTLSVQIDEGLNALIVQGPSSDFPIIQALVDQLDIPRPEASTVHVVYLKFAQASELVDLLIGLQQPGVADDTGAVPRSEVTIQADDQSNSLIIRAEQKDFEDIAYVISQLDVRREQVFIETIIAEVSFNKESEIGVDWSGNYRTDGGGDLSANTGFSPTVGGFELGFVNRFFENLSGDIVPNLNIVLRALRSDNNTNIISTPNLLTLDNEEAEIVVGQEVPFVTGSYTTDASTGGVIDTDDGEVAGVINPFQTIERRDVGLTLRVTPQINEGNTIRLEIEQELSNVSVQASQGASDLVTDNRSIKATVQVDDDQIIVLGGLIRDDSVDSVQWVPVLGKLPLIGVLFRKKRKEAVKTNLMVFLQPKIIRTPDDLSKITKDRYEFIRAEEVESQPDTRLLLPDQPPSLKKLEWTTPEIEQSR